MKEKNDTVMYDEIGRTLHSLQKVNAPAGFEADLMRRINSAEWDKRKSRLLDRLLTPSRLIPSTALAAAAVFMLFMFNLQTENPENPLMADPRVREDFIITEGITLSKDKSEGLTRQKGQDSSNLFSGERYVSSAGNGALLINKTGLNFRRVHLTDVEKQQILRLKNKIRSFLSPKTSK